MSNDNEDLEVMITPEAELASLKTRADLLGVKFHPSISVEKLREKLNAALVTEAPVPDEPSVVAAVPEETLVQRRFRKKREANALVRIRVTCMNPAKKDWAGEIFTSGNSLVGSFTKFVPFNADEGWHVPNIIVEQIKERQCQIFVPVKDSRGNTTRKGKMIKEFAIEVMPDLTPEELAELARRQAMSKAID
jgi:hypothetical protein